MNEIKDIIGIYKAFEKEKDSEFSNNFQLKIFTTERKEIKFDFEMKTEGKFGVIGKNWYGKGIYRSDHLALVIEKEKDWTLLQTDKKTVEYLRDKNESLPIEIYTEQGRVIVYHKNLDRYILLKKTNS